MSDTPTVPTVPTATGCATGTLINLPVGVPKNCMPIDMLREGDRVWNGSSGAGTVMLVRGLPYDRLLFRLKALHDESPYAGLIVTPNTMVWSSVTGDTFAWRAASELMRGDFLESYGKPVAIGPVETLPNAPGGAVWALALDGGNQYVANGFLIRGIFG